MTLSSSIKKKDNFFPKFKETNCYIGQPGLMTPFQTVYFTKLSNLTELITHLRLYDVSKFPPEKFLLIKLQRGKNLFGKLPRGKLPQIHFYVYSHIDIFRILRRILPKKTPPDTFLISFSKNCFDVIFFNYVFKVVNTWTQTIKSIETYRKDPSKSVEIVRLLACERWKSSTKKLLKRF